VGSYVSCSNYVEGFYFFWEILAFMLSEDV
jgi:hypothetical protein